jgi:hypothetical protein
MWQWAPSRYALEISRLWHNNRWTAHHELLDSNYGVPIDRFLLSRIQCMLLGLLVNGTTYAVDLIHPGMSAAAMGNVWGWAASMLVPVLTPAEAWPAAQGLAVCCSHWFAS